MSPPNNDAQVLAGTLGTRNIIALDTHRKTTTKATKFKHRHRAQYPAQSDAAAPPLRTILDLVLDVRIALADGQDRAVRLFLGSAAMEQAEAWRVRHGVGTALALPEGVDPKLIPWPAIEKVVVVRNYLDEFPSLSLCEAIASSLRNHGIGYASIPHLADWPNLWPWSTSCGAA